MNMTVRAVWNNIYYPHSVINLVKKFKNSRANCFVKKYSTSIRGKGIGIFQGMNKAKGITKGCLKKVTGNLNLILD